MGRGGQLVPAQPPPQWLDVVARYCANSERCQDAFAAFPYFSNSPHLSLPRWVGHDEDRAAALILSIRSSSATCANVYNYFGELTMPPSPFLHWEGVGGMPESVLEWGCCNEGVVGPHGAVGIDRTVWDAGTSMDLEWGRINKCHGGE